MKTSMICISSAQMILRILVLGLFALGGTSVLADSSIATITTPTGSVTAAANATVSFAATSSDPGGLVGFSVNGYSWAFGDGGTGSGASTSHAYGTPGTYTATLTVSYGYQICKTMDLDGNCLTYQNRTGTATATRTITVLAPPVISRFSASASSVGVGKPVTLSWSTTNATNLSISGVGAVTGTSKEVYPAGTSNTYVLTASNAVGTATSTVTVTTYTVGVSISPAGVNLKLGEGRTFTALVSPANQGVTWTATGGILSGSTLTSTTFTANSSGIYTVKATSVEDPSKSITASGTVATVTVATPVPANVEVFVGGSVSFSADVLGAANSGVTWTVDGGGSISAPGVFTASSQGTFHVTARSQQDPTKSSVATVKVIPLVVTITPETVTVRSGETKAFSAAITGGGEPSQAVTWSVVSAGGGTITQGGFYTAPETSNDYIVKATSVQDPTCFGTATVHVPGWKLRWKRDIVYVGTKEIAEIDGTGIHVTLVDHLGSPRFVVDAQGVVEAEQKFLPFGEQLTDANSMAKVAKGFTNHEQTDASGLIYMQARFYAPWYGRFLSPDPARDQHFEETQSWNIYSYVQNNPTMLIDPNGMALQDPNYQISLGSRRPDLLIVHDTAGQLSRKGFDGMKARHELSGHLYVDRGGEIWENRPLSRNAPATKAEWSTTSADKRLNSNMTVNVELNNPIKDPSITDKQYGTLAQVAVGILGGIDGNLTISPHREIDRGIPNGHEDPRGFDPAKFEAALREACKKAGIDYSRVQMAPKEAWSRRNTAGAKRQTPPEKKKEEKK